MNERERNEGILEAEAVVHELADELTRTQKTRLDVESLCVRLEHLRESLAAYQSVIDKAHDQLAAASGPLLLATTLLSDGTQRIDNLSTSVQRSLTDLADAVRAGREATRDLEARLDAGLRHQFMADCGLAATLLQNLLLGGVCLALLLVRKG